jgi:hypothetical protein
MHAAAVYAGWQLGNWYNNWVNSNNKTWAINNANTAKKLAL